jgi:hypothetical protein
MSQVLIARLLAVMPVESPIDREAYAAAIAAEVVRARAAQACSGGRRTTSEASNEGSESGGSWRVGDAEKIDFAPRLAG